MAQSLGPYGEEESLERVRGIRLYRGPQTSREQVGRDRKNDPWKVSHLTCHEGSH